VDDFLGQVRDFLDILRGVERSILDDGENEIIWRVTNAQMNSPIWVELTPFPKNPAIFVEDRAEQVERATIDGIIAINEGNQRPRYFNDDIMTKAQKIFSRVTNGLSDTSFGFDSSVSEIPFIIDRTKARRAQEVFLAMKAQAPVPYKEMGSIEGFITKAELDGFGRAVLRFKSRIDGSEIKAIATGDAFQQLESLRLSDVWQGVRVRVYGMISYRSLGVIESLNATGIEVLDQSQLPGLDDILDENFTGGMTSESYLVSLRDG
jgi:hypothetical protein